jgi:hypothetical protein
LDISFKEIKFPSLFSARSIITLNAYLPFVHIIIAFV